MGIEERDNWGLGFLFSLDTLADLHEDLRQRVKKVTLPGI